MGARGRAVVRNPSRPLAAHAASAGGRNIRRMIVKLTKKGAEQVTNEHGQTNPWHEVDFQGSNVLVDNSLRRFLAPFLT